MKQTSDIADSAHDNNRIQNKETIIDLPEIKDIPGQEHVRVMPLGEISDTTISSDDEEGKGLLDTLNKDENIEGTANKNDTDSSNISPEEAKLLDDTDLSSSTDDTDEIEFRNETLDKTDKDGELLNEEDAGDEFSGSDLDVPGTEEDDEDEKIGEEDEENNIYSPSQK